MKKENYIWFVLDAAVRSLQSLGGLYLCQVRRFFGKTKNEYKSIAFIQLGHMGDMLLTLPAVIAAKNAFPSADVSVITGTEGADVMRSFLPGYRVVEYKSAKYSRKKFPGENAPSMSDYGLIIFVRGDFAAALQCYRNMRAKFIHALPKRNLLRNMARYLFCNSKHKVKISHQYNILSEAMSQIGVRMPQRPSVPADPRWLEQAETLLPGIMKGGIKYAVIHAGAPWPMRRWPAENFAALCGRLKTEHNLNIIIIGAESERYIAEYFRSSGVEVIDLIGKLDLKLLSAVISKCSLYIGNDSGPAHLAAMLGARGVVFYGPQDPAIFGVLADSMERLYERLFCSPCWQNKCIYADYNCTARISVQTAVEAAKNVLGR